MKYSMLWHSALTIVGSSLLFTQANGLLDNNCYGSGTPAEVEAIVVYSPLVISAYVAAPTTISVNEKVTLTVTECPTTIITTTYCSTTIIKTLNALVPASTGAYTQGPVADISIVPGRGTSPAGVVVTALPPTSPVYITTWAKGPFTTRIKSHSTTPYTRTGLLSTPGGFIPATGFNPPASPLYSTTWTHGTNVSTPYTYNVTRSTSSTTPPVASSMPPPDVITTIFKSCLAANSSCLVTTIPPTPGCTHPCTTSVITYPPPTSRRTPTTSFPRSTPPTSSSSSIPKISSSSSTRPVPSLRSNTTTSLSSTTTSSSSTTSTTLASCTRPTCATGVMRAQYPNPFGDQGGFNERFNTTYYRENRPNNQTTVTQLNDIDGAAWDNLSFEFTTFVYSCAGGSFTFNITYADDIALAWFGDTACGDFEKANNQSSSSYHGGVGQGHSYTTVLDPGQYFPVRLIYANANGPASLDMTISGPNGTAEGDYFYPTPCDNSNSFVAFGTEAQEGRTCAKP